jgi:hypothetical protein
MKCVLNLEGTNDGAKFLEKYIDQEVDIQSLYKNIDVKSPPLLVMKTSDDKQSSLQIIDVRFIDDFIFLHCYAVEDKDGGRALIRLKPV